MTSVGASEARASLHELLDRVDQGEEIVITRRGRPVAILARPDAVRDRRIEAAFAAAAEVDDLLTAAVTGERALTAQRAEELVRDIRAARNAR